MDSTAGNPNLSALFFNPSTSLFPPPPPPHLQPPPYAASDGVYAFPHHQHHHQPLSTAAVLQNPSPSPNSNPGAQLMALLTPNPNPSCCTAKVELAVLPPLMPEMTTGVFSKSSKKPRGRWLEGGKMVVYDVDLRGEEESAAPQLEATPITKYVSDPVLVLGRQIAVNRMYICYGLKLGVIRVLNCNTALRALLKGHTMRVADMAFFAEDVNLLASASVDGKVFIWKIDENPDEESMPQISRRVVVAIHFVGDHSLYHPQICWHSHKQEILFVGVGNCVLRINTTEVGKGIEFSAEEPLKCSLEKLIDGVHLIGKHNGEVTCLSVSQLMATCLASASKDGTLVIWDESKLLPLITFKPHDGYPVSFVHFMTSPHRPEHINLVTAGHLNREVKIWASAGNEGWLLPNELVSWQCIQTFNFISSSKTQLEEAFFNQIVILSQIGLLICANAKRNAIYAMHIDYGSCPTSTHMDCIADFTVAMPILSLIGICDSLPDVGLLVKVYCVQTQAIQQYALDLVQCLPSHATYSEFEKSHLSHIRESTGREGSVIAATCKTSANEFPLGSISLKTRNISETSNISAAPYPVNSISNDVTDVREYSTLKNEYQLSAQLHEGEYGALPSASFIPLSLGLAGKVPAMATHESSEKLHDFDCSDIRGADIRDTDSLDASATLRIEKNSGLNDLSMTAMAKMNFEISDDVCGQINPPKIFLNYFSSPKTNVNQCPIFEEDKGAGMIINQFKSSDMENNIDDGGSLCQHENYEPQTGSLSCLAAKNEVFSQPSKSLFEVDINTVVDNSTTEGTHPDVTVPAAESTRNSPISVGVSRSSSPRDMSEMYTTETQPFSASLQGMQKEQHFQTSNYHLSPSPFNSTGSLNGPRSRFDAHSVDSTLPHMFELQVSLNQLMHMQKETQRQMTAILSSPSAKEGKRIEAALNRSMEKIVKANIDALWARIGEDTAKRQKAEKERIQLLTNSITNCLNKDLPVMLERAFKKEMFAIGSVIGRATAPIITSAIYESFQRGVGDKGVNQLEKSVTSKLDTTVAKQIQTQFQVTGKQVLQDLLKSCLESSVVPGFERSCKAAFEQVDKSFQKGFSEHATAALKQFEAAHAPLALTLNDAVISASSITQNLMSELIRGQNKIVALVAAGNAETSKPNVIQQINAPVAGLPEMIGTPINPMRELAKLVSEKKYEEAFTAALQRSDVSIVSWLCSQVDLHVICSLEPLPLSQGVLLSLLQQLACDISNETAKKVSWMNIVAISINPSDPMIAAYASTVLGQIYHILNHQRSLPTVATSEAANIRLLMHVINSLIMSCR